MAYLFQLQRAVLLRDGYKQRRGPVLMFSPEARELALGDEVLMYIKKCVRGAGILMGSLCEGKDMS